MKRNNKKTLSLVTISVIFLFTVFNIVALAVSPTASDNIEIANIQSTTNETILSTEPEILVLSTEPLLFPELDYVVSYDVNFYNELLAKILSSLNQLKAAVISDNYTAEAYKAMHDEINRLEIIENKIKSNVTKMNTWESDYYYATHVWSFLLNQGYSEAAVSGIIGNMMVETSGGTLDLKPFEYNPSDDYYGLCQWSLYYHPTAADRSFEQQLEYLLSTLEEEFNTFGNCYANGFTYEDFLKIVNPEDAAKAFATVYERCDSSSYNQRMEAALKVYNYFSLYGSDR